MIVEYTINGQKVIPKETKDGVFEVTFDQVCENFIFSVHHQRDNMTFETTIGIIQL